MTVPILTEATPLVGRNDADALMLWHVRCARCRAVGLRNAGMLVLGCATVDEAIAKLEQAVRHRRKILGSKRAAKVTAQLECAIGWLREASR